MPTKGMELVEGYLCQDHIYMLLSVLSKYKYRDGGRLFERKKYDLYSSRCKKAAWLFGRSFWSRGHNVITVRREGQQIRKYSGAGETSDD